MAFQFDLDNLPPLLRVSDICRDPKRGYPGILPMTRSAFLTAVEDGYIAPPVKLGAKVVAWRREDILAIVEHGVQGRRARGRKALAREAQRQAAAEAASSD
jgi:prophage regulatory protein